MQKNGVESLIMLDGNIGGYESHVGTERNDKGITPESWKSIRCDGSEWCSVYLRG